MIIFFYHNMQAYLILETYYKLHPSHSDQKGRTQVGSRWEKNIQANQYETDWVGPLFGIFTTQPEPTQPKHSWVDSGSGTWLGYSLFLFFVLFCWGRGEFGTHFHNFIVSPNCE